MSLSCSILTRPTPGAPRRAYSQATTAVLWEPCGRGGRFADSLSGWLGLSGLSRSQPNEPNKLNKPEKPDGPDSRHAPRNVGLQDLRCPPKNTWIKNHRSVAQTPLGCDSSVPGGAAGGCGTPRRGPIGHLVGKSCPLSKVSVKSWPPQPAPDSARLYSQYPLPVMQQEGPVRIPLAHPF